jgi:uncharacterized membrane protein YfcA
MTEVVLLGILVVIAGSVGTITGFGTSTIMVPILVPFYGLPTTLLLVGIVHWFGDIWKVWLFRQGIRWKPILLFAALGVPTTVIGASLVFQVNEDILARMLGGLLVAYVGFLLIKPHFKVRETAATILGGGALYGFSAGIFGIGGAIRGAVLAAYDLPKAVYISTAGAIGLLVDSGRIVTYLASEAALKPRLWWGMLLLIPATLAGAKLGKTVVSHVPEDKFRWVIAAFLVASGLKLLLAP